MAISRCRSIFPGPQVEVRTHLRGFAQAHLVPEQHAAAAAQGKLHLNWEGGKFMGESNLNWDHSWIFEEELWDHWENHWVNYH